VSVGSYVPIKRRFFACLLIVSAVPFAMMHLYMWQSTRRAAVASVTALLTGQARLMLASAGSDRDAPGQVLAESTAYYAGTVEGELSGPEGPMKDFVLHHVSLDCERLVDPGRPFAFAGAGPPSDRVYVAAETGRLFASMRGQQAELALMSGFVYVLAIAASFFLARGLTAPVKRLAARLRKEMAEGLDSGAAESAGKPVGPSSDSSVDRPQKETVRLRRKIRRVGNWADSVASGLERVVRSLDEPIARMVTRLRLLDEEGLRFLANAVQERMSEFRRWAGFHREYLETLSEQTWPAQRTDVLEMLERVRRNQAEDLDAKGVECELPDASVVLIAPARPLERILALLIAQATRLAQEAERPLVKVEAIPYDGGCGFAVRASGRPLEGDAAVLVDFFAVQKQPLSDTRVDLGLAVAARLVRMLGGEMKVVATEESGTAIMFSVPQLEV